jgi:hypothetical protein
MWFFGILVANGISDSLIFIKNWLLFSKNPKIVKIFELFEKK